jgi:hypothetical protein
MATTAISPPTAFGVITVDGQPYIERVQIFTAEVTIGAAKETFTKLQLTMPGIAPFLLKGLTRDAISPASAPDRYGDRRFRFNLSNSQGSTWFFSSGLWVFDDRVVDTMCFGNGQFPYPLIPPIPVPANGTLMYEIEDMGLSDPLDQLESDFYPYTLYFGFHGSYLFPVQ